MPETLTELGFYVFENCEALEKVYIGKNIEYIGEECFKDCLALSEIQINLTRSEFCHNCEYGISSDYIVDSDQYLQRIFNVDSILYIKFNEGGE